MRFVSRGLGLLLFTLPGALSLAGCGNENEASVRGGPSGTYKGTPPQTEGDYLKQQQEIAKEVTKLKRSKAAPK
jgi:hypothetical protein